MIYENVVQRSEEWYALRIGRITASNFHKVNTGGEKTWSSLVNSLNNPKEFYSKHTEWGKDYEDEAVNLFEFLHGVDTKKVGFITHDTLMAGCSPDFIVSASVGGEVKCPSNPVNHTAVLLSKEVPKQYIAQVQGSMWITGASEWWFLSYDPRQTPDNRLVSLLIKRDNAFIERLEKKVINFLDVWKNGTDISKHFCNIEGELPKLF